jgi:hypothetical protein
VDHLRLDRAADRHGGYSLLRLINRGDALTPFQANWFRAGHAHAGVLVLMSPLYYTFLDQTAYSAPIKHLACAALVVGILAQSGGFFVHMMAGEPGKASVGTMVTTIGAAILVGAIAVLPPRKRSGATTAAAMPVSLRQPAS